MKRADIEKDNLTYRHGWFTAELLKKRFGMGATVKVLWNIAYQKPNDGHLVFDQGVAYSISFPDERQAGLLVGVINSREHPWFNNPEAFVTPQGDQRLRADDYPLAGNWEQEYEAYVVRRYLKRQLGSLEQVQAVTEALKLFLK